jgi:hypothetical protein
MMLETAITVRNVPAALSSSTASILDPSLRNGNSLNLSGARGRINAETEAGRAIEHHSGDRAARADQGEI